MARRSNEAKSLADAPFDYVSAKAEGEATKWTWPDLLHVFAWACPIVIFACMIIGWRLLPENTTGLYSATDGNYTKWNYEYAFEWGNWFDLSIFNPFSGLGSTFWTNTPWLNPGAWALQLPFSPLTTITISYLVHLAAYGLTFYWLGRAAGASKLAIGYALGLLILLWLPPFASFWGTIVLYSLAPFRLINAAAANLIFLSLVIAVQSKDDRLRFAKALAVGLAGLIWGIYASATYFVFDLLIVAGFFVVLVCCARPASAARRLLLLASMLVIAFVASGMVGYVDALMSISVRTRPQLSDIIKGLTELIFDESVRNAFVAHASTCYGPGGRFLPCFYDLVGILLLPPLFFSLYAAITSNIVFRALLLCYLLLQFGFWFFATAEAIALFPSLSDFGIGHVAFAANTFVILSYMIICDALQRLADQRRLGSGSGLSAAAFSQPGRLARLGLWGMFAVPVTAAVLITFFFVIRDPNVRLYPSLPEAIIQGVYKGDAETSIVHHLRQEIGLNIGGTFRGVAATYIGNNLTMERTFGKQNRYDKAWTSPLFLFVFTQNPHQNTGLWEFGIPTYDEYAHMITRGLYNFTKELLTDHKTPFNYRTIRAYELVPDILHMLGVRFVLSDAAVDMPDFIEVERIEVKGDQPVELFLYRLEGANLANWSPVDVRVIKDNKALLNALKRDEASLRDRVFLSSDPPRALNDLVSMQRGKLSFDRNEFRFQGESAGWSLALLPLQFSHCWSQTGESLNSHVHLLRANYLLTGLLFKGTVDIRYKFDFRPWRSRCRIADAEMVQ
jgi:hypothetical protein